MPVRPETAFHLMAKPMGPICNLDCKYCFYLEKENYYPQAERFQMSDAVLEEYVRQYIEAQDVPEIHFAWQGGEPTLMGVDFFRRAVAFQQNYANGKEITNGFQTNGTLLDEEWGAFLAEHDFLIGISIDGPPRLHDYFRVDKRQQNTHKKVIAGLEILKRHQVGFNTLTVLTRKNADHPLKIYRYLKEIGSEHMQFIPIIERKPGDRAIKEKLDFSGPPSLDEFPGEDSPVMPFSVQPLQFGRFLTATFDEWVRNDVGRIFVNYFDNALASWCGFNPSMCVFNETCGKALILEHDGTVYSCDHFMYPEYDVGNLMEKPLREIVDSPRQEKFGQDKFDKLPRYCLECDVRFACNGECPKHRFVRTPDGEPGLNYLCPGLKHFFHHIDPYMKTMAGLLGRQQPPAAIMEILREQEKSSARGRSR